ncbi:unnamed protein product, partial [Rotaria magnacalcarata]
LISEQLRNLRRKFSGRTDAIKEIIHQLPDYADNANGSISASEEKPQEQLPIRSVFASDS